jgi:hypothetical protein
MNNSVSLTMHKINCTKITEHNLDVTCKTDIFVKNKKVSALKKEAAYSSEMFVSIHQITQRHIP